MSDTMNNKGDERFYVPPPMVIGIIERAIAGLAEPTPYTIVRLRAFSTATLRVVYGWLDEHVRSAGLEDVDLWQQWLSATQEALTANSLPTVNLRHAWRQESGVGRLQTGKRPARLTRRLYPDGDTYFAA